MKLTRVDALPENTTYMAKTKLLKLLEEFVESGFEFARVDEFPHKSATTAASAFRAAAKRFRLGVDVTQRKNEVYLIRRSAK